MQFLEFTPYTTHRILDNITYWYDNPPPYLGNPASPGYLSLFPLLFSVTINCCNIAQNGACKYYRDTVSVVKFTGKATSLREIAIIPGHRVYPMKNTYWPLCNIHLEFLVSHTKWSENYIFGQYIPYCREEKTLSIFWEDTHTHNQLYQLHTCISPTYYALHTMLTTQYCLVYNIYIRRTIHPHTTHAHISRAHASPLV